MTLNKQGAGFVLPIVVLLMAAMGLVWSGGWVPPKSESELQQEQQLEAELLFWHKALVAFSFEFGQGVSNFYQLLRFYDLERPDYTLENGQVVTFSNSPTIQNLVEINVDNLPDEVVQYYLQSYPRGLRSNRRGRLTFGAMRIDRWEFAKDLIPRETRDGSYIAVDLDIAQQQILGVQAMYAANTNASNGQFNGNSHVNQGDVTSSQVAILSAKKATVAGIELGTFVDQWQRLEAQMAPCLAAGGSCRN